MGQQQIVAPQYGRPANRQRRRFIGTYCCKCKATTRHNPGVTQEHCPACGHGTCDKCGVASEPVL